MTPATYLCPSCKTRLKLAKPVPAATRIRCSRCNTVFTPTEAEILPDAVKKAPRPEPAEEPEDRPRRPSKPRPLRKSRVGLLVGLGLLLVLGAGGALTFLFWDDVSRLLGINKEADRKPGPVVAGPGSKPNPPVIPPGPDDGKGKPPPVAGNPPAGELLVVGPRVAPADKAPLPGTGQHIVGVFRALFGDKKDRIQALAFSPDGRYLASNAGSKVLIWDAKTAKVLRTLAVPDGGRFPPSVIGLAFAPDGQTLASCGGMGGIRLWDVPTCSVRATLPDAKSILKIAFSADGKTLASLNADGDVKLWDVDGKTVRTSFPRAADQPFVAAPLALAPDGKTVAVGGKGNTIALLDVATGVARAPLKGHAKQVYTLAFSPDGKTLASGTFDGNQVKLWDVATGTEKRTVKDVTGLVLVLTFSPSGKTLAVGRGNGTLLLDPETGQTRGSVSGLRGTIEALAFTPDGNALAAVDMHDRRIMVWDLEVSRQKRTIPFASYGTAVVSPDGKTLAVSSAGVDLVDLTTGKKKKLTGTPPGVTSMAFAPDGATLALSAFDDKVRLWGVAGMKERAVLQGVFGNKTLRYTPDGMMLAVGGNDGGIQLWNTKTNVLGTTLRGHRKAVRCLAFSADGKTLASGAEDATARLWDVTAKKQRHVLPAHEAQVGAIALSPDGTKLATAAGVDADRTIRLWDVATGKELPERIDFHLLPKVDPAAATAKEAPAFAGHAGTVTGLLFAPDGKSLISAGSDRLIRVWEVATGKERAALPGSDEGIYGLAVFPDGKSLVTMDFKVIKVWQVADLLPPPSAARTDLARTPRGPASSPPPAFAPLKALLEDPDKQFRLLALSPDGQTLAAAAGKTVTLWDVAARKPLHTLAGHTSDVEGLAFALGGTVVVSGGKDRMVRMWDAKTGKPLRSWEAAKDQTIQCLAVSPDGQTVATGFESFTTSVVKLWDVRTGAEKQRLVKDGGRVNAVAFSPDGTMLAAGGLDSHTRVWDVASGREKWAFKIDQQVYAVAFSSDSSKLASVGGELESGEVRLWDVKMGQPLRNFTVRSSGLLVASVQFSPDGKVLATAGLEWGANLTLWSVATGKELRIVAGPNDVGYRSLVFFPDGKTLASAGTMKGGIKLWHAPDLLDDHLQAAVGPILQVGGSMVREGDLYRVMLVVRGRNTTAALAQVKAIPRPTALVLKYSDNLTDDGLANLVGADNLVALNLEGARAVTDAGLKHLVGLKGLRQLNLSGLDQVTDAGLEHLAKLKALTGLTLSGTRVTKAGLLRLKELTNLHALDLRGLNVPDDAVAALAGLPHLTDLSLEGTPITDAGVAALKPLTGLHRLSLAFTFTTDKALAALEGMKDLTTLDLRYTKVTDAGLAHLAGLTKLRTLSLGGTQVKGPGFEHLARLTKLTELNVDGLEKLTGAGLEHLKGLAGLTELNLASTGVTDAGLVHVKDLTQLRKLLLPERITDEGLKHLAKLTNLTSLNVSQLKALSGPGLAALTGLTELDLSQTKVTDEGLKHLAGLTRLQSLTLPPVITDKGLVHLKGLVNLTNLNLAGTKVGDAGLANLAGLTKLETLDLTRTGLTDAGLRPLEGLKNLTRLRIGETKVTDKGREQLRKALPHTDVWSF